MSLCCAQFYSDLVQTSVDQLNSKDGVRLALASLRIKYISAEAGVEMGVDAGGLYRDWLGRVASALFDPRLGLFTETDEVDGIRYLRLSEATAALAMSEQQILEHYRFAGRLIALSLRDQLPICANLAPPLCRLLVAAQNEHAAQQVDNTLRASRRGIVHRQLDPASELNAWAEASLTADDIRYISMATFSACLDASLSPAAREANIREGDLTFATESRELLSHIAEREIDEEGQPKLVSPRPVRARTLNRAISDISPQQEVRMQVNSSPRNVLTA